jgi:hypothetical protein
VKLLDRFALKTTAGMVWLLVRELRRLTHAIEVGVDSFRTVHGHQPAFDGFKPVSEYDVDAGRTVPHFESDAPDYLRLDIIECLCREHHIPVEDSTNLLDIARAQHWIDESGDLVVMPKDYLT